MPCSEEVFLLEAGLAKEGARGTCLEGSSAEAFPMSFAEGGAGERMVSSTWVASCSEGSAYFGVLVICDRVYGWLLWRIWLKVWQRDLWRLLWRFVEVGEGEATGYGETEEVPKRKATSLRTMGRYVLLAGVLNRLFGFSILKVGI